MQAAGLFQSTLPVGGATAYGMDASTAYQISIHAPRGGSDIFNKLANNVNINFNPRSPWGERLSQTDLDMLSKLFQSTLPVGGATPQKSSQRTEWVKFQSTLPVGGATSLMEIPTELPTDFNPRSPWGERQSDYNNL